MHTIYMPWVSNGSQLHTREPTTNPEGFGIAVRSQCYKTPYTLVHELLNPPCWHDWGAWREGPSNRYPYIWNPVEDMHSAWNPTITKANPEQRWFIGNEPLHADQARTIWCPPERMAEQANTFYGETGVPYILCGEVPDNAGIAYTARLRQLCNPAGFQWHIYEKDIAKWQKAVERCIQFEPNLPVYITETNARWGSVDDQRRLMDVIMETLDVFREVHAVFWYVTWAPDCPPNETLLTHDGPDCQLTITGQHYVQLTK